MFTNTVVLVCYFGLTHLFQGGNPTQEDPCVGGNCLELESSSHWLSDEESCSSVGDRCLGDTSDVARTIIRDLYKTIKTAEEDIANSNEYPPDYRPEDGEEFDFIVVGAGSAGAVVANRLSEITSWKVLLIEAGGNPTKSSELAGLATTLQLTDIDWQYKSDPEENICLGMMNKSCNLPRGKVLGGSSTINFMMYVRGNAKDYDHWAAAGNTGWSYEEVLPYFKKSEGMRVTDVLATNDGEKYHGRDGYLKIEPWTHSKTDSLVEIFGKGLEELGYPFNLDYNGKRQTGFTRFHGTLDGHKRCSTAKAFLSSVKDRKNLKVSKYSLVTKVLIDKDSSSVYGVEFLNKEGKAIKVRSRKEVILSGGAINTPQVLMLSGVGPKKHLLDLKLQALLDLPVGKNFQDHPLLTSLVVSFNYSVPPIDMVKGMFDFVTKSEGALTNMRALSYSAFVNTQKSEINDFPDMQFIPMHFSKDDPEAVRHMFTKLGAQESIINEFTNINKKSDIVIFFGSLLRPFSRGTVSLKSTNPKNHPKIVTGTLTDERDIETFLRTYDFMEKLVETKAMKSVDAKLREVRLPGCEKHTFPSREYRECTLRHLTTTTYHLSGTCKMGPSTDPEAVVDPDLRVLGMKGLRVADASIMPTIVSGNINAAVIMIGEKAADLIKKDWL